jgi:hypothetical protein
LFFYPDLIIYSAFDQDSLERMARAQKFAFSKFFLDLIEKMKTADIARKTEEKRLLSEIDELKTSKNKLLESNNNRDKLLQVRNCSASFF